MLNDVLVSMDNKIEIQSKQDLIEAKKQKLNDSQKMALQIVQKIAFSEMKSVEPVVRQN